MEADGYHAEVTSGLFEWLAGFSGTFTGDDARQQVFALCTVFNPRLILVQSESKVSVVTASIRGTWVRVAETLFRRRWTKLLRTGKLRELKSIVSR